MNAKAEIKTPENLTEIYTPNEDIIILKYNKYHQDSKFLHQDKPKKSNNMTTYLSKYGYMLSKISINKIDIDKMLYSEKTCEEYYKYDKEFTNEKNMNKQIINLIIDMYYYGFLQYGEANRRLREKINYLISYKINDPYFLIEYLGEKGTYHPINYLFKFIKTTIKGKDGSKIYEKLINCKCEYIPEIEAEPLKQNFKCSVCFDDVEYQYIINYNCNCKDLICRECYENLTQPKKCPLCRKNPYKLNLTIAEDEPEKRRFTIKHNNKIYEENFDIEKLDNFTLYFFDTDKNKIVYFKYEHKTDEELLNEFVEDDDKLFSFCCYKATIDYIKFNSRTELKQRPLKYLLDGYYEDGDGYDEFIENVLMLNNNDDRLEFIDEYYNCNGIASLSDELEENIFHQYDFNGRPNNILVDNKNVAEKFFKKD